MGGILVVVVVVVVVCVCVCWGGVGGGGVANKSHYILLAIVDLHKQAHSGKFSVW